jgi:hypothetical protein
MVGFQAPELGNPELLEKEMGLFVAPEHLIVWTTTYLAYKESSFLAIP